MSGQFLRSRIVVSACALMALAMPAFADETLHYGPAEPWVTAEAPGKPDATFAGAPYQLLLHNAQLNFRPDGTTSYYTEVAIHIQTVEGLQEAQYYVTWNPATDEATVNKAQILRGGQVIDVLAQGQKFTTMRREENLDEAMLDGYLTGVIQPEGIQVGDTFVVGSTLKRRDPVFGGKGEFIMGDLSAGAVSRQVVRASWDRAQPIQWRQSGDLKGRIVKTGADDAYVLERNKVTQAEVQANAPARFNENGFVEFSQFKTWNEVSALLAPWYEKATTLSPDSPLRKEVAIIRAASNDPKVQAAMALKLVQTRVRYVFLGMNLGGYVPAEADATWQRRFGDCKGKSALLVAILRELGIKAEAAAVNSGGGDGLDQHLPSIEMFDHVIVRAEIDGKVYWLDGTRLGDRDLDSIRPPYVRWALPMTTAGAALEAVPMLPPEKPTEEMYFRLDASAGLDVPARTRIEKTLRGDEAVQFDAAYRAMATDAREEALKGYWKEDYKWIEPRKVSATFDPVTGEEKLVMDGVARMEWNAGSDGRSWRYQTDALLMGWGRGLNRDSGPHKSAPVIVGFPHYERTRQEIILPKGGKDFTIEGEPIDKTLGGTEFKRQVTLKDGVLTLDTSRRSLVPEISYKDAKAAEPVLTDLWKKDVYLVAPKAYRKDRSQGTAAATVGASVGGDSQTAEELALEAVKLIQQNRGDEALAKLNKALEKDPSLVMALSARGTVFMTRGNANAARADFEMAVKTDPSQWTAWNGLGAVHGSQFRTAEAIDAYTRAIDIYPNNTYALKQRAGAYVLLRDFDKARADAEALRDIEGDTLGVVSLRVDIETNDHKREAARTIIEDAIAASPDNTDLQIMLPALLTNCVNVEAKACEASNAQAVLEYDRLIAAGPKLPYYVMRAQARPEKDRAKALEDLNAAIAMDETSAWAMAAKAQLLIKDKAYEKAMVLAEKMVADEPKDTSGRILRAEIFLKTGRKDQAIAEFAQMKREYPKAAMIYNTSCWDLATHDVELEKALADCDTGLKLSPRAPAILDSRGFVKLRLGRYDEAIADYDAALAVVPELVASLYGRGLAKLRKGDKAGGEADLNAARKLWYRIDDDFSEYGVKP